MSRTWKWIIGILIALVVLAAVAFAFRSYLPAALRGDEWTWTMRPRGIMPFGRGWTMHWPGMMGYGGSFFGGLFGSLLSLGLLALVVLSIVWLVRRLTTPLPPPAPTLTCRNCGQPIQAGWVACPHCGKKL